LCASLPYEFLSFSANGQQQSIDILGSLWVLVENDYAVLALLQVLAVLLLPAFILLSLLYLLLPHIFGMRPVNAKWVVKVLFALLPWTMAEIFLIGVLVSLVKIISLADIGLGLSFYAYVLFTISMTLTLMYVDKYQLKQLVELDHTQDVKPFTPQLSIQKTWAFLITSMLLYIPANTLPIMYTNVIGDSEPNTILGGVIVLWKMGSYPIAIIIFIASVFIPVAKILIMCWLNYSIQTHQQKAQKERMFFYRITEFVGRWSMIDVFVVAILVSLIQLGNIMSIVPGHAALAFCSVVIFTMLAAMSFDSRLIWQPLKIQHNRDNPT
jgi:paraquat-inducible protein A